MCAFVCEALPLPLLVLAKTVLPPAIARTKMTQATDVVLMQSRCFDHAESAAAFFFLRQPSRPNAPKPVAKSGSAAGRGVAPETSTTSNCRVRDPITVKLKPSNRRSCSKIEKLGETKLAKTYSMGSDVEL